MSQHTVTRALPRRARLSSHALRALGLCVVLCSVGISYAVHAGTHASGNPLLSLTPPSEARPTEGRVVQRLPAGSYTYLALKLAQGDEPRWVVTMGQGQPLNTRVKVRSFGTQRDFYSNRLQRSFRELSFGIVSKTH
jgi:hypothetical protein